MYNRLKTAFVVLVVMCCFAAVGHANNLTVFDGTQVSPYVPLPTANYNVPGTRGQVIYPASELTAMVGQPISAITLYVNNEGCKMNGGALRVSMGEVEESVFSAPSFFTELTTVALAEMRTGLEEIDIDFDTPYIYGGGNLVIDFYVQVAGSSEAYNFTYFYGLFQQGHTSMTTGDEGNEYREFIPKTTFEYGETPAYSAKTSPRHVTFNTIRSGESDVYTIYLKNNGLNAFTATVSADAPFSASMPAGGLLEPGATQEIVVAFEPVEAGTFDGVLSIDCGQAGVLEVPLSGTALENGTDFTVCDGTSVNAKLPFNGVYFSDAGTYGQMIYPADMLADIAGSKIVALSFYTNKPTVLKDGTVQISLKETDQSEFTSKVAVADMTPVASMPLAKGLEVITFYFDTPYKYMGGNLAVEARVMDSNGNYGTTQFYGEVTDYNAGLSVTHSQWSGDNAELIKFLPKVTFTCQADAALPGDVNNDSEVNISDVIKLINAVLNDDFTEVNLVNADLDNNNEINISDVIDLINKVLNNN
ncbi:MAG: hypothetical protein IKW85_03370 [Muribaculaceae bacterium]|nr:hypothetical protein [Muribaculaceae bacterium]